MKNRMIGAGCTLGLLVAFAGRAQQNSALRPAHVAYQTPAGRAAAVAAPAVTEFIKHHAAAKTMTFTARTWTLYPEAPDVLRAEQTYEVAVRRPNLFAVHVTRPDTQEKMTDRGVVVRFSGELESASISDGKQRLILQSPAPGLVSYEIKPAPKTYLEDESGALADIMPRVALDKLLLDGFQPAPDETLFRKPVAVFVFDMPASDHKTGYILNEKLYFARDTGELMRWSSFVQEAGSKLVEQIRVEYGDWKFNPRLPSSTFRAKPPVGALSISALRAKATVKQAAAPTNP